MDENRINLRSAVPEDAEAVYRVHVSMGGSIPWADADESREHIEWMTGLANPPIVAELDGEVVAEMVRAGRVVA